MSDDAFERAVRTFDAADAHAHEPLAHDGGAVRFTHGKRTPRVTVFFHGLTAGPRQFAPLAAHVYAGGDNVLMPRLPRHGHADRMTDNLRHLRADELVAFVAEHIAVARAFGDRVRVVGFSLGGLLAAWSAQHESVDRAIAVAPLLGIAGVPRGLTPLLARRMLQLQNRFLWWNPLVRERMLPARGYPRYPTHAVAEGLGLAARLAEAAAHAAPRAPITLVINRGESAVNNAAIRRLAAAWRATGAANVRVHTLHGIGPSHDIIEVEHNPAVVARSYGALLALLDGEEERTGV